jgi:hypothetical protein
MSEKDEVIECPSYRVCGGLGLEMRQRCCYRTSELPPPGMHRFDPKEEWRPAGVQANVLMLGYMLSGEAANPAATGDALARVRRWARGAGEVKHG